MDASSRTTGCAIAENVFVVGDVGGAGDAHPPRPLQRRGGRAGRARRRLSALPRRDPAGDLHRSGDRLGRALLLEQAKERGIDAAEYTIDIGTSSKGYTAQAQGHVTIVVDRATRRLVGAFMAGPAVSEAIHECVLAIRADIPLAVLADTIHAFPTVARVLGTAFIDADRDLPA